MIKDTSPILFLFTIAFFASILLPSCNSIEYNPQELSSPSVTWDTFVDCIKDIDNKLGKAYQIVLSPETRKRYSYDEFAYALKKHKYSETFCDIILESKKNIPNITSDYATMKINFEDLNIDVKFVKSFNETAKVDEWRIDFDFNRDLPEIKYKNSPDLEPEEVFESYKKCLMEKTYWNAYIFIDVPKEKLFPAYKLFYRALKHPKGETYVQNIANARIIKKDIFVRNEIPYCILEVLWGDGRKKFVIARPEENWVVLFDFENALGMTDEEKKSLYF